ncbi:FAD-dependent monooxygenase [Leucobacter allii]|uniref:FAD-dependent monooxygenase n=1 Tax=Leucobacter allii TaxID=2932247 RepID=UPI001FD0BD6E|nr:FAD-dependent monooxygenase [Leucobacter allii]UOR01140.1 FAD-dependent monooxygenase [Leucobacter allii]
MTPSTHPQTARRALSTLPDRARVLVAGAGPSGLMLALDLAERGIPTLVIEPRVAVDPYRPRAKTTNARTMTLLRRLGLADRLRAAAPLNADYSEDVVFCTGLGGHELRRFRHAFQLYRAGFPHAPEAGQQVPQPTVERVLRAAAAEHPLIDLALGLRVTGTEARAEDVLVTVTAEGAESAEGAEGDGGTEDAGAASEAVVRAEYVVGADGGSSAVRRSLGIRLAGTSAPRPNFNVVFRSRALAERVSVDTAVQYWVVGEVSGMIGQLDLDGLWWVIAQGVDPEECTDPEGLVRRLAGVGDDLDVEVLGTDPWTARMLLADSYGGGRVFLVGDAAHLNPPFGGHGFNTCVLDALNLSWKIAAVLGGSADAALLESYEAERRPAARRMIDVAAHNTRHLAYTFVDPALDADGAAGERARAAAHERLAVKEAEFLAEGLVLGYAYPGSPIVTDDGRPVPEPDAVTYRPTAAPGHLLPHLWLDDGRAVYDALGPEFTLVALVDRVPGADAAGAGAAVLAAVDAAVGATVPPTALQTLELPDGPARDRARALWEADYVLVRPDQHVAWRGDDPAQLAGALRRSLGRGLRAGRAEASREARAEPMP